MKGKILNILTSLVFVITALGILLIGCVVEPEKAEEEKTEEIGKVTRVIDGDTFEIELDGKLYKVRLIGVNAPEKGQPFADKAEAKLKELVLGKKEKPMR
mgnify:CR=1 FL=1